MPLKIFGSSFNTVGSSSSNLILKCKGAIKIQWGSKYIDLIKDGKINSDSQFIFKVKEVGTKDGIYVVDDGDTPKIVLSVNGTQVDLNKEGNTYVSFLGGQKTSSEQKYTALQNIGFIYKDLQSIQSDSLQNGIIYVESEQKLYVIQDGQFSEFSALPNPLTNQLVISKSDSQQGALIIKGTGFKNSLLFDSLQIYSEKTNNYIQSNNPLTIGVKGNTLQIDQDKTTFNNQVILPKLQSSTASNTQGFKLYTNNGLSTLEVDKLVVRHSNESVEDPSIYSKYWYREVNIIQSLEEDESKITLTLYYPNKFKVNDSVYTYLSETSALISLKIVKSENYSVVVQLVDTEEEISDWTSLKGQLLFLAGSEGKISILRRDNENIDLIESSSFEDEQSLDSISTRIGNIGELNLNGKEGAITGTGIYSDNGCFLKAQYTSNYDLPNNDSSTKFASTEWTNNLVPKGSIIMFSGDISTIPNIWNICDGTNGTPDLSEKFVKKSEDEYSLIYIMKIN